MTLGEIIASVEAGTFDKDRLLRLAFRVTHNYADAEDAVQEALIACWHYDTQGKKVENAEGYLVKLVRNKAVNIIRARRTEREVVDELEDFGLNLSPETRLIRQEEIDHALGGLTGRQLEVFTAVTLDHATQEEVAEELGISQQSVCKHLTKAWERVVERRSELRNERRDT